MNINSLALIVAISVTNAAVGQEAKNKPARYVGEIIIIGNTITKDRVIREKIHFYPGQVLRDGDLKTAERNITALGLFKVDPAQKIRPTVQALDNPGPHKDILIRVEETTTSNLKAVPGLNVFGQPILRLVIVERNFDPWRFPVVHYTDFQSGRAFRGNGQLAHIELVRFHLLQCRFEFLQGNGSLQAFYSARPKTDPPADEKDIRPASKAVVPPLTPMR